MFTKTLNFGLVAEMRYGDFHKQIVAQSMNIQIGNDVLRVGIFEPEKLRFDLLARPRHQLTAAVEGGTLRQKHPRIGAKHLLGKKVQCRLRTSAASLSAAMGKVRNHAIGFGSRDQLPIAGRAGTVAGTPALDGRDMGKGAVRGFSPNQFCLPAAPAIACILMF